VCEEAAPPSHSFAVTDPKVAGHFRSSSDVLACATSHSLEEWVGGKAADAVLSHPTPQALERRVGSAAACAVSPHPAWLHEVWAGQRNYYSSSSELIVIGDGIWMRAQIATPWDALAAALNWAAVTPV
jgi:hypothetical protein